jgi:hypothetical protein
LEEAFGLIPLLVCLNKNYAISIESHPLIDFIRFVAGWVAINTNIPAGTITTLRN